MADKTGVADEAVGGLKALFARLGEFFHIFDLSFLVAGAATLGALLQINDRLGLGLLIPASGWIRGLALVLAAYVCGLVSFSLGRTVNRPLFRRPAINKQLPNALSAHQLRGPTIERYKAGGIEAWRVYIRMWQELAGKYPTSVAFSHLSRYWAMAATYDGLAISFLIWMVAISPIPWLGSTLMSTPLTALLMLVLLGASILCLKEGGKYYGFQVEDLVAALAAADAAV
jgi:hypothetical protein